MNLRESYDACRDMNVVFERMGISSCGVYVGIRWLSLHSYTLTTNVDDFINFVNEMISDDTIKNFILDNLDTFDFEWNKIHYPDDIAIIGISKKMLCTLSDGNTTNIEISLEYSLD